MAEVNRAARRHTAASAKEAGGFGRSLFVEGGNTESSFLLISPRSCAALPSIQPTGASTEENKPEILQGTLDLMVVKALNAMRPLHGYRIARPIEHGPTGDADPKGGIDRRDCEAGSPGTGPRRWWPFS
jgi:hypothetical protein